jgi:hypothetical protein
VSAYVTVDAAVEAPEAELNTVNPDRPFAKVALSADRHTVLVFHTPGEARALAAVLERAAVLLDEHAASRDGAS